MASATVANANVGEMSAITSWGLKLSGESQTFTVGKLQNTITSFEVSLSGFGTTTTTVDQTPDRGNGTFEQIAELEYFAQGFDGIIDRVGDSSPTLRADATSGETYDVISIEHFLVSDNNTVSGSRPAKRLEMIAVPDGTNQSADVLAVLNPWMASLPKAFANVSV